MERMLAAWQEAVFERYLAEEKIGPDIVDNMRSWQHSGFSVDQSVFLPAGDQAGIERRLCKSHRPMQTVNIWTTTGKTYSPKK